MKAHTYVIKMIAALLCCGAASPALAAEPAPAYQYTGGISGVVCAACSKKVKASLQKLPGVTSVRITADKQPGLAKVEIVSASPAITEELAIKALGKDADAYHLQSLKRADPPSEGAAPPSSK